MGPACLWHTAVVAGVLEKRIIEESSSRSLSHIQGTELSFEW